MPGRKISALRSPYYSNLIGNATFSIGVEGSNTITVAVQLKDTSNQDLAVRGAVEVFLADDANGDTYTATAATGIAAGTDGWSFPYVTGKASKFMSEADGDIDVAINYTVGAKTWYLGVILPDGSRVMSGAITFA